MKNRRLAMAGLVAVPLIALVVFLLKLKIAEDKILLSSNTDNDDAVVLLLDTNFSRCSSDKVERGKQVVFVGNARSNGNCKAETVVFSDDNAMGLEPKEWSDSASDKQSIVLKGILNVPVNIWIMYKDYRQRSKIAWDAVGLASKLYNVSNCGFVFMRKWDLFHNAVDDPDTRLLLDANCSRAGELRSKIGFISGSLNIYFLRNPGDLGVWCGRDTILMGNSSEPETLAHEFGHSFGLQHTTGVGHIPPKNLMLEISRRDNITEGQCFRCNMEPSSRLNPLVRHGQTRGCPIEGSRRCPPLIFEEAIN